MLEKEKGYSEKYPKEVFDLPVIVNEGEIISLKVKQRMKQYLEYLQSQEALKAYYPAVAEIYEAYCQCMSEFFKGNMKEANRIVVGILDYLMNNAQIQLVKPLKDCVAHPNQLEHLYKARTGDYYGFPKEEMFHIPFDQRKNVTNHRFSMNGIPCLYLGTSTYVCWEELNRPLLDHFWVSRFKVEDPNLNVLDLSLSWQDFGMAGENASQLEKAYLLGWIVQCACSVKVNERGRSFREEYVFPQLLMQNIRELKIDGIAYLSVDGQYYYKHSAYIMKNFAFPALDHEDNALRLSPKLIKCFSLSEPINMNMFISVLANGIMEQQEEIGKGQNSSYGAKLPFTAMAMVPMNDMINESYENTNFYRLEKYMDLAPTQMIPKE